MKPIIMPDPEDLRRLEELEAVVSAGLKAGNEAVELRNAAMTSRAAAVKAGNAAARALYEIKTYRGGLLWRKDFKTFVDYCHHKWGVRKSQAYRLTETGSFIAELEDKFSPVGEIPAVPEYHFRQFCTVVPEEHRLECWQEISAGKDPADLTAAKMMSAAKMYLHERGLDPVPERVTKQPPDNSRARTKAMGLLDKLRAAVAGFSQQEKFGRAFSEFTALIENATDAPAIEVEATATGAGDKVAPDLPTGEVASEGDETPDGNPLVLKVDAPARTATPHADEPRLPLPHGESDSQEQPLSDEPASSGQARRMPMRMPMRMPVGTTKQHGRSFMDARKFHRVVMPGTDFNEWFEMATAMHPGDFGTSDNGEIPTITLLRARDLAFHATGELCITAQKIIQDVVASGVADPGAVVDARFDDLINGSYVNQESGMHKAARFDEEGSEG